MNYGVCGNFKISTHSIYNIRMLEILSMSLEVNNNIYIQQPLANLSTD